VSATRPTAVAEFGSVDCSSSERSHRISRAIGPLSVCCSGLNGRPSYRNRRTRRRVTITNRLCLVVPAHDCAIWHVTKCADQRERRNARYGSTHPPIVPDAHDCPLQGNRTSWTRVAGGSSARGAPTVAANLQPRTHLITFPSALFASHKSKSGDGARLTTPPRICPEEHSPLENPQFNTNLGVIFQCVSPPAGADADTSLHPRMHRTITLRPAPFVTAVTTSSKSVVGD
jgi:hypothetical protein